MSTINYLPKYDISTSTTGCCPVFNPDEWDNKTFTFYDKLFAKVSVRSFFHMPVNMGHVMKKIQNEIAEKNADEDAYVMLSHEVSAWKSDHYLAVKKNLPSYEMTKISGTFMTKVFEGKFNEMPKWRRQLLDMVKSEGKTPVKTYFFYTTCPNCAKVYGKNYVVGFEKVVTSDQPAKSYARLPVYY